MVAQSETDYSVTLSDGATAVVNMYWDDAFSDRPIIGMTHGAGGDRTNNDSFCAELASDGHFAFTYDARGEGDGRLGNTAAQGKTTWSNRDLLDPWEILEAIIEYKSALVDPEKIGWMGSSQGGLHAWSMMALSDQIPPSGFDTDINRFRKITAISPAGIPADVVKYTTNTGNGYADPLVEIFSDLSAVTTYEPTGLQGVRDAMDLGLQSFKNYIGGVSNDKYLNWPVKMPNLVRGNNHTAVLAYADWDDNWANAYLTAQLIEQLNTDLGEYDGALSANTTPARPNCVAKFGSWGHHRCTEVGSERSDRKLQRRAFFLALLKGDNSNLDTYFGDADPGIPTISTWSDVSQLEFSITPNSAANYIKTTGLSGYDRATGYCRTMRFFNNATDTSLNSDAATYFFKASNAMALTGDVSQSSYTLSHENTNNKTLSDFTAYRATGTAEAFINANFTQNNVDFVVNWPNSNDAIMCGTPKVVVYASSQREGALLSCELVYVTSGGATLQFVSSGQVRFPDVYERGRIIPLEINLDPNAIFLNGAAGVSLAVRFSNIAYKRPPYGDNAATPAETGFKGLRAQPDFFDNDITIYVGGDTPSKILLPLHDETLTVLDA